MESEGPPPDPPQPAATEVVDGPGAGEAPDAAPGGPRRRWRGGGLPRGWLFLLLLALCAPMVALHVDRHRPLFVIDELAYADYLHKVHDGQPFVRHGEQYGQEAMRALACRGYFPDIWPDRPACGAATYDPADFPFAGVNPADIHPPTYFVVTDAGARLLLGLGLADDLIEAGRLFGAVWLAAGLLALWHLLRGLGVDRRAAAVALGLVTAYPMLRWHWHYLMPDAANLLVGSLVMLAAVRWERTGRGLALLAGAGAVAMAVRAPNLMVVTAVAGYLLVRGLLARRAAGAEDDPAVPFQAPRRYLAAAASLLGGGAAMSLVWLVARSALAVPGATSPLTESLTVGTLRPGQVLGNVGRFAAVWDVPGSRVYTLILIASYLLVVSLLVALVAFGPRDRRHTLALVTGLVVLVGPLLVVAVTFVTNGTYFGVEPRYGATLIPLECAVAASLWRSKAVVVPVGALVATCHVAALNVLLRP